MKKDKLFMTVWVLLTAVGVTVTGIIFRQSPLRIAPLYVSLVVYILNSRLNRYGVLVGSLNSLLYAVAYVYYKLYASAISAVIFSFTFQMLTFIRWNKHPYGSSTVLKHLTFKKAVMIIVIFAIAQCGTVTVLSLLNSSNTMLDTFSSLIGLLASILMLLSYYEYTYVNIISCLAGMALYMQMIPEHPEQVTYLVFSVYSTVCCFIAVRRAIRLYKKQREENI